ncbi:hypothetical protein BC833DRAFT_139015 [Globomyces pollinis-pini]|nr:hypothetical protein BC833DRAFT_139015 [Globomyces pollinis-pini]
MQDLPTIHIPLSISIDLYRSDLSRQLDTQIIVKFPFLSLFTRFNLLQEFKAQYYTDTLSQVANTTIKPQAITSIEVIIPQCRLKLEFISDHFNNRSPIIDLLNLRLNNTESFNNWNLDIPLLLFGYHIPTKDTFKHISYTSAVSIKFNNQDDIVEQGLSEQLMSTQHKLLRESNASDSISARSWSDVGEESPRVGIGKCRSPPLETQDPSIMASKYIIRVQSGKLVVEVDQIDFVFMKWIGETLQQLAFKPLEANQPSTAVIFDIQHVNVALTNTGTNFYHRYDLYDINGITSLNSILNCKNLLSIELHVYDVKWYTNTAFHDHPSWCALTRVPSSTEHPMIHLLYTQNDDLDIHVRQILLTLMLRHTFLHLPFKSPIDIFNDPGSFYEPLPTLLESFMDLQVCVSDFQHSHCTTDAISIVKYDHLKCATNIISGSSTCGIDVTINNIHLFLTVNTSLIAILQKNEYQVDFNDINATVASFHMMGFANLAILEGLNVNVRLNDVGVYPSADWSIGFINLTVMTRNDSMQALIGYLNSFAP